MNPNLNMPIYSAILSGEPVHTIDPRDRNLFEINDPELHRKTVLLPSVPFDVQLASEMFWHCSDYADFPGAFRLPYPNIWMEWQTPEDGKTPFYSAGSLVEMEIDEAARVFGPSLKVRPGASKAVYAGLYNVFPTAENRLKGKILRNPLHRIIQVDDDGTEVANAVVWVGDEDTQYSNIADYEKGLEDLTVAWTALQIINCSNVTTRPAGKVRIKRTTAQKRRREMADLRYHTIVLPGTRYSSQGSQTGDHHQDLAVHKVRGHPKFFGPDAPLFGKHVGTFWWNWQIRGNPQHGEVVSDYRLDHTA